MGEERVSKDISCYIVFFEVIVELHSERCDYVPQNVALLQWIICHHGKAAWADARLFLLFNKSKSLKRYIFPYSDHFASFPLYKYSKYFQG